MHIPKLELEYKLSIELKLINNLNKKKKNHMYKEKKEIKKKKAATKNMYNECLCMKAT